MPFPSAKFSLPVRLATINFLANAAFEASGVYMALYARSIGSSDMQVGFTVAGLGISLFLSSFIFGRLSDNYGRVKFIQAGLALTAVSYFLQFLVHSPWTLIAVRSLLGFGIGMHMSPIMAYTYEQQKQIGGFISFGALGWLLGALLASILKDYGTLFILSTGLCLVPFILTLALKEEKESIGRVRVSTFPVKLIGSNYRIFFSFFLRQLGAMAIWTIWPLYLTGLGASKFWISMMDVTNMGGQFIATRIFDRFDPAKMFRFGLILSTVVFAIYGIVNHYLELLPVQIMLATSYAALFIGGLNYLLWRHHEHGTISGLMNSTNSLANSFGPFLGGAVSQAWGYPSVMFIGAGLSFIGLLTSRGLSFIRKTVKTSGEG